MEAATKERELSGEKAQRIIDAMRESVAKRGAAGSTFEHVAGEAGVSRGLLHYYFGTKERLLVEVVRRDAEIRVARLDEPLAQGRDGRRRARRPARQPHRPDRERTGLLPASLRAVQRRPPQPRDPARGRPALRPHPLPRRRDPRGEGARGRAQPALRAPTRSSPTCSRSATASPCRRSPSRDATSARRSPPAPPPPGSCSPASRRRWGSDRPHAYPFYVEAEEEHLHSSFLWSDPGFQAHCRSLACVLGLGHPLIVSASNGFPKRFGAGLADKGHLDNCQAGSLLCPYPLGPLNRGSRCRVALGRLLLFLGAPTVGAADRPFIVA